jgi:3-deoxy-manno-octulosonate cytidylyltransferase (CMP-KDO synthetase)
MADYHIVIPARYASTRLPGKPLAQLAGRSMIEHVHDRARAAGAASVVVATDSARIEAVCREFGAAVCLTHAEHASGTDRIAEVIERMGWPDDAIVVNLQGDEPLMPPVLLDQVAADLAAHPDAAVATLATPLQHAEQVHDENVVKVVRDRAGYALYFSRAAIPWRRGSFVPGGTPDPEWPDGMLRHLGLYAYRAGLVREFVTWPPAPIEQVEALEQLRVLWNGRRIHVSLAEEPPPAGVDTPEDLARVEALLAGA